ncbi:uncharacterized protein P884DRAFT_116109 [Thermothelomyces heterothallicus CBS 202.75]|uniref:uncharacterized protein n=1 Tax=Thermothelomyces heterothallicus CBS 202.75 TaxID=1149848 RepID=UPI00374398A5
MPILSFPGPSCRVQVIRTWDGSTRVAWTLCGFLSLSGDGTDAAGTRFGSPDMQTWWQGGRRHARECMVAMGKKLCHEAQGRYVARASGDRGGRQEEKRSTWPPWKAISILSTLRHASCPLSFPFVLCGCILFLSIPVFHRDCFVPCLASHPCSLFPAVWCFRDQHKPNRIFSLVFFPPIATALSLSILLETTISGMLAISR